MSRYHLSRKADADIEQIARTSLRLWGLVRAEIYVLGLHDAFERLSAFPELGRDASEIRPGVLRFESTSHVILYRIEDDGILILRVLHARMDVSQRL
jgi:toxin ParE1/3/4